MRFPQLCDVFLTVLTTCASQTAAQVTPQAMMTASFVGMVCVFTTNEGVTAMGKQGGAGARRGWGEKGGAGRWGGVDSGARWVRLRGLAART